MNNISFNKDSSCVSIASDDGSKIFNCEPFGEIYHEDDPMFILKVLFSTSLTIIVSKHKDNRLLKIYNLKQNLKICELIFPSSIVDIKINKKRLVVILKIGQIYIYDLSYVKLVKIIEIEPLNSSPFVGDLSNDDTSLLVIPLKYVSAKKNDLFTSPESLIKFNDPKDYKDPKGWILVYDTINLKSVLIMKCHSSSVKKIMVSNDIIGTASSKGTIIRLFYMNFQNEVNLMKIQNLRRGHNPAQIHCLSLNKHQNILACGSESTIHFFNLNTESNDITPEPVVNDELESSQTSLNDSSKLSEDLNENLANLLISKPDEELDTGDSKYWKISKKITSRYTKKILNNLPYQDYFNNLVVLPPERSFNIIKIKDHFPIEIGFLDDLILVASYSGKFYQYKFDDTRRECRLINQYTM